ncbi:MAG: acyltransferase [Lachnospiraceae bacterium]|nr:acyltransferase [Lachnospiraceae bacterium]
MDKATGKKERIPVNSKAKLDFYNLTKIRPYIMGLATILIVLFHLEIPDYSGSNILVNILLFIRNHGNIGVELFLMASQIGCYFSFSKSENKKEFYKRRFTKVFPLVLYINAIWGVTYRELGIKNVLKIITGIAFFTDGRRLYWYFIMLAFTYLVFPYIYSLSKKKEYYIWMLLVLTYVMNAIIKLCCPELFGNTEILLRRMPAVLIGFMLGKYAYSRKKQNIFIYVFGMIFVILGCTVLVLTNSTLLGRYVYAYIALGIIIILEMQYKFGVLPFKIMVEKIGIYSLEAYLLFEKVIKILEKSRCPKGSYYITLNVIAIAITALLCVLIHKFYNNILAAASKSKKNTIDTE